MIDHLPHYEPTERTRYRVRVEIDGSVEWLSSLLTLADAQRRYASVRDMTGLGGSGFSTGDVFDEAGQHIARISYNGRLWPALPWQPGMPPLAEMPR